MTALAHTKRSLNSCVVDALMDKDPTWALDDANQAVAEYCGTQNVLERVRRRYSDECREID